MDFGLSEEQEMLQETVRGFVSNECPPPRLREIFDAGEGHDPALWSGLSEMGIAGLVVDEEHGGAALELLDLALVSEVLGAACLPAPFLGHSLACLAIMRGGRPEQKARWLPRLAEGELVGGIALQEAAAGWAADSFSTKLEGGRVEGEKQFVPNAAQAGLFVVATHGGGLAVVEHSTPGVQIEDQGGIDRSRPISRVRFDATAAEPLEAAGDALYADLSAAAWALLAADAFGAALSLIDLSVEYAKTREQFGMKIGQFQAVKHQLARLGTDIEPTRGLYWYAAYAFDHLRGEAAHACALAKAHITDRAMNTARMAVELHGGLGFTWECDVQMWFKRAMFDRSFLGTPEALREHCASLSGWSAS